jgi:hypothetical protein
MFIIQCLTSVSVWYGSKFGLLDQAVFVIEFHVTNQKLVNQQIFYY